MSGPAGTFIRFRDSHDGAWLGPRVQIVGWQPWTPGAWGSYRVFFGTNSQALTANQLNRIVFANPMGWPAGNYPARILSTGEIVPAIPPALLVSSSGGRLILSWPGEYQLLTATNVAGPYSAIAEASSPFTNQFVASQRYFRLGLRAP